MNLLGAIGKKPCEISLQKILEKENNRKLTNKVMHIILTFKEGLKCLESMTNSKYFNAFTSLWLETYIEKVNNIPTENIDLKTHLRCCVSAYHREHMGKSRLIHRINPEKLSKLYWKK